MKNCIFNEVKRLKRTYGTSNPYELIDAMNIHLIWKCNLGALKGFYYVALRERYIVTFKLYGMMQRGYPINLPNLLDVCLKKRYY